MANKSYSSCESLELSILILASLMLTSPAFCCVPQWWPHRNTPTVPPDYIRFTHVRGYSRLSPAPGLRLKVPLPSLVQTQRPDRGYNERAREWALRAIRAHITRRRRYGSYIRHQKSHMACRNRQSRQQSRKNRRGRFRTYTG